MNDKAIILTVDEAEMIDIWADNTIEDMKRRGNVSEGDRSELQVAVLIRAKMRTAYPAIQESVEVVDACIRELFTKKGERK